MAVAAVDGQLAGVLDIEVVLVVAAVLAAALNFGQG